MMRRVARADAMSMVRGAVALEEPVSRRVGIVPRTRRAEARLLAVVMSMMAVRQGRVAVLALMSAARRWPLMMSALVSHIVRPVVPAVRRLDAIRWRRPRSVSVTVARTAEPAVLLPRARIHDARVERVAAMAIRGAVPRTVLVAGRRLMVIAGKRGHGAAATIALMMSALVAGVLATHLRVG